MTGKDPEGPLAFIRSMPVLDVKDVLRSEAFYVDMLGFTSHAVPAGCAISTCGIPMAT